MREFNFETVFQILYKPLTSNTNIKKEELYRDIFLDLYLLTGRFREDEEDTAPFRKFTSGNLPIQKYVAKKLHTEKGFELVRKSIEDHYLGYFENYDGIIRDLMQLLKEDTFISSRIKQKILTSCTVPASLFEASRFVAAILVCADYKKRFGGKKGKEVFLNIDFMHLSDTEEAPVYPLYRTESPEDVVSSFKGREAELEKLEKYIIREKQSVLLTGIGGLGKTELVKKLLNQIMNQKAIDCGIQYVAWVPYIHSNLAQSCKVAFQLQDDTEQAWMYVQYLAAKYREKLLIVIDNVEKQNEDRYLKRLNDLPCRVLVTSRYKEVSALPVYELGTLEKAECRQLFYHFYQLGKNDEYLDDIIGLASCHTIMVEFLAKVAQSEGMKLEILLERLIEKGFKLSEEDVSGSHERLQNKDNIISQMCILFSLVNIKDTDKEILTYTSVIPNIPFDFEKAKGWFGVRKNSILRNLFDMGMLEKSKKNRKDIYWMHSVIASAVREQQKDVLYDRTRPFIEKLSLELDYGEQWGQGYKKAYLIPFSWSVTDIMENKLESEDDVDFLTRLFYVCFECGSYKLCEELIERILKIDESKENIEYVYLVRDYKNQGDILLKMEKVNEALDVFEKAEHLLKDNEWDQMERMSVWHKIGTAYHMKGDYQTAKNYYENILDTEEKMKEISIRELSTDYTSLGCLYLDMGMYQKAYENIKKAVELDMEREEDADSIMTYYYLASACAELSSEGHDDYYEEAEACFEKVILFREANYQRPNTDLADVYHEYSLFCYYNGQLDKAMDYSKRAYDINISVHSEYSVSVIRNRNTQGIILEAMGEIDEALDVYEEVLDIAEELDNVPSDDLASFHFNKAEALVRKEAFDDAIISYETSKILWSDALTEESGKLAPVYQGLGKCYMEKEDYGNAICFFSKSLDLNDENIELEIDVKSHLGECWYFAGNMECAEKFFLEVLEQVEKLGEDGIGRKIELCLNLCTVYSTKNDVNKAVEFWKEAKEEVEETGDDSLIEYVKDYLKNS